MGSMSIFSVFIFLTPFILKGALGKSPRVQVLYPDCVCSLSRCPPNEEPGCRDACPPETCITLYVAIDCIANQTCKQGCYCKKGFLRTTTNGTCIPQDQCLPLECVNDPNAKRGCGNRCGKTCEDYNNKNKICPPMPCKKNGCECKDGWVYDKNVGICVKPDQCTKQCTKPHERYSSCLLGECVPKTCADLGRPLACPAIAEPCAGGCICKEGYVKDSEGNCIDAKACPSCGDDANAESGCGNPCGKTCDSLNKTDLICPLYCEVNGCDCKKGFALNTATKKCTPIKDCPKPPRVCPKNEAPGCRTPCPPETCITKYVAIDCVPGQTCVDGCYCKPGYLRTSPNGTCVPQNECLPLECVNDPNAKRGCGNRCGKTCADYKDKGKICPKGPCKKEGCDCKDGLVYDKNLDRCVKPTECTKQCTKPHERYSNCLLGECVPKTCADLGRPLACPAIAGPCAGGCICEEGYVKDSKGNCIDKRSCPSCGGDFNAVSGCGNPCGKTCDTLYVSNKKTVCPQYCNTNGCDCKEGFLLNTVTKKCTPIKDCPKPPRVCPPNEQPGCRNSCPPETCITLYAAFRCIANQTCVEGCFCKPGFLRTSTNGTCVPKEQCLPLECVNDPNAQRGCGIRCGKTCEDYNVKNKICPLGPCKLNGCDCKDGYVYDNNVQKCVKPLQCTTLCAENEEFYCGSSCPQASCSNPNPPICINKRCEFKCFCKKGFVRDANNKCTPANKCPLICNKPHERFIDCLAGQCSPKTCDDLGRSIPCPFRAGPCPGGCICEEGYLRAPNGTCIEQGLCPPKPCGTNQTWVTTCNGLCPDSFCPRDDKPLPPCEPLLPCYPGCQCKLNYRLNATRSCILTPDCPAVKCTKQNEVWDSCSSPCLAENCEDVNNQPTTCNTLIWLCSPRCVCAKGHFRNKDGLCVPASKCPKPCPNPNEKYIDCLAGQCNPKTCNELINPAPCPRVRPPCPGGCICVDGYVHDANGVCVKKEACQTEDVPPKCPPNEALKSRVSCPPDTCDTLYLSFLCVADQVPSVVCTCKDNYLRTNSTGVCVPTDRCLPPECANDPNAIRGCGNRCKKTCSDYNDTNKICKNNVCKLFGCDCKEGWVYDEIKNICVKPHQCTKLCKGAHERYSNCLLGECVAKTCEDLGRPIACPSIASPCAGGCICEEGYVKDSRGNCIEKKECPSCGGDPHAESGCGNPCGKTCAGLGANEAALFCPLYCETNGCDCKKGYRLNTATNKCVLEKDCPRPPQQCGQNEEYYCGTSCPEASCQNPEPPICVNKKCKQACFCKKGFVRDPSNKCIPVDKCPSPCKGPHERYISCPAGQCQPKTCDNLINPAPCPRIIPPCPWGCICEEGYLKDSKGICIPKNECPELACNSNQTYVTCNDNCPDKYCPKDDQPQPVCDAPRNCPPGCTCKINYRLDKTGKCILASDCPEFNCTRENEVFTSCYTECLAENCEDADTPPTVCNTLLLNCQPKCICKKSHFRNSQGLCVPAKDCPSVCKDPNAQWKDCISPCPGTCQNTKPVCLSKTCTAGCQCNEGYVLSKEGGKCVPIDTCADYIKCGANQTFVPCTFRCPQVMCPESDQTILCKPPRDCSGGCGCKDNYRYNANDECILGSDCPPVECTRKNEEWAPCRSEYDWERCDDRYNTPPIVPDDNVYCNPRCVCIKGYYRNNSNECVPENECPPIS